MKYRMEGEEDESDAEEYYLYFIPISPPLEDCELRDDVDDAIDDAIQSIVFNFVME